MPEQDSAMQDDQLNTQKLGLVERSQLEALILGASKTPLTAEDPSTPHTERFPALVMSSEAPDQSSMIPAPLADMEKWEGKKGSGGQKRDLAALRMFQEVCHHLSLSIFYRENSSARSLGFTSSINGEGKSFLSAVTANVLSSSGGRHVTLLECNWEHPSIHEYYGFSGTPGVAEWLRNECQEDDIRRQVARNLTVIPAGNGRKDAVRLIEQVHQNGMLKLFAPRNELLVVDLPSIATTAYGQFASSLLDAVVVVVHAGVTPNTMVQETCSRLKELPVQGIVLNQLQSKIPRWLRQIL
jgi:protein-tyrosine kinase